MFDVMSDVRFSQACKCYWVRSHMKGSLGMVPGTMTGMLICPPILENSPVGIYSLSPESDSKRLLSQPQLNLNSSWEWQSNHTTHNNFEGTSRQLRKLIFGMQPYFDPTRKTTSKKNGRRPQTNKKINGKRPQKNNGNGRWPTWFFLKLAWRPRKKWKATWKTKWKTT